VTSVQPVGAIVAALEQEFAAAAGRLHTFNTPTGE
jgi:hypothetical protein